jgi:hypothetical protein
MKELPVPAEKLVQLRSRKVSPLTGGAPHGVEEPPPGSAESWAEWTDDKPTSLLVPSHKAMCAGADVKVWLPVVPVAPEPDTLKLTPPSPFNLIIFAFLWRLSAGETPEKISNRRGLRYVTKLGHFINIYIWRYVHNL